MGKRNIELRETITEPNPGGAWGGEETRRLIPETETIFEFR